MSDPQTLEAISLALGEYDRQLVSHTLSRSETRHRFFEHDTPPTDSESVTYQTQRQRTLSPGEIAHLPAGRGLLLRGTRWRLLTLASWHRTEPWVAVAEAQALDASRLAAYAQPSTYEEQPSRQPAGRQVYGRSRSLA